MTVFFRLFLIFTTFYFFSLAQTTENDPTVVTGSPKGNVAIVPESDVKKYIFEAQKYRNTLGKSCDLKMLQSLAESKKWMNCFVNFNKDCFSFVDPALLTLGGGGLAIGTMSLDGFFKSFDKRNWSKLENLKRLAGNIKDPIAKARALRKIDMLYSSQRQAKLTRKIKDLDEPFRKWLFERKNIAALKDLAKKGHLALHGSKVLSAISFNSTMSKAIPLGAKCLGGLGFLIGFGDTIFEKYLKSVSNDMKCQSPYEFIALVPNERANCVLDFSPGNEKLKAFLALDEKDKLNKLSADPTLCSYVSMVSQYADDNVKDIIKEINSVKILGRPECSTKTPGQRKINMSYKNAKIEVSYFNRAIRAKTTESDDENDFDEERFRDAYQIKPFGKDDERGSTTFNYGFVKNDDQETYEYLPVKVSRLTNHGVKKEMTMDEFVTQSQGREAHQVEYAKQHRMLNATTFWSTIVDQCCEQDGSEQQKKCFEEMPNFLPESRRSKILETKTKPQ